MDSASDISARANADVPEEGQSKSSTSLLQAAVSYLEFQASLAGDVVPLGLSGPVSTPPPDVITDAMPETKHATAESDIADAAAAAAGYAPYEQLRAAIPSDSPLHGMGTLEEVERFVANTVLIPLDESRLNPVFGVGNPAADLLVIGEAPGADEDKKGEPFVGRAGQLLDKILQAIGFARNDVYIANILKSRPPNNRNPSAIEVAAHLPLLLKQIMLIQPKLILCVGRTAGTSLLGVESSLSALRGRFHDFHGVPVMVTYHPAALLRNPNWKPATWEDVQALRARYDELTGTDDGQH